MFLRNAWYVAAWESEIKDKPLARTILGEPVVMFRCGDRIAVLEDRCCHRAAPLSLGRVVETNLQCGYHGLEFDGMGNCIQVPGQAKVPPGASVRSYPVIQRYGWVWIWTGDPAKANEELLPNWWWIESPEWKTIPGRYGTPLYVEANYLLISDNLFDITHLPYVHAGSIGADSIMEFPTKTERFENVVKMSRVVEDRPAAPFYQKAGSFKGNVDRWAMTTTQIPCYIQNDSASVEVGSGVTPGFVEEKSGVEMKIFHLPTPETETSTHYFYAHTRHFKVNDPEWDEIYRTQFTAVIEEDKVMLDAQQANLTLRPDAPTVDINADAAGLQFRRILERAIRDEQTA